MEIGVFIINEEDEILDHISGTKGLMKQIDWRHT